MQAFRVVFAAYLGVDGAAEPADVVAARGDTHVAGFYLLVSQSI